MHSRGSVTNLIEQMKAGDDEAEAKLYGRYWPILVNLARQKLGGAPKRVADEEDIAQEAFFSFHRSLRAGKFPALDSREGLLALLTSITARRVASQNERQRAQKRGGGQVRGDSALRAAGSSGSGDRKSVV